MSKLFHHKFSDLYEMSSGISSKPEQAGHGAPFISFKTVFNNYFLPEELPDLMDTSEVEQSIFSVKEGDIFLTRTSETLDELGMSSVAYRDYPNTTYSGFLKRLRPLKPDETYPKYMAFYLRSKLFRKTMNNNATMTLRASLNEQIFSYLDLLLPSYKEQKNIGDLLFSIYEKIELNNSINIELEKMAKTIYDYWFVQFDFPNEDGKPYKSSGGKMLYNETLQHTIPNNWQIKKLGDFVKSINTGLNPRDHFKLGTGENFYITIKNIEYGRLTINSSCDNIDNEALERIQKRSKLEKGDILFTSIQPVGKTFLLYEQPQNWNINESVFSFKPNLNIVTSEYLFMLLSSEDVKQKCQNSSTGSIHKGIRITPLKEFSFAYPSKTIIKSFTEKISPILEKINHTQQQNQELASLRDWLLPMLMNGQIKIE
ncbi:restriction endonuclease subunit S [Chryseobacterium indologenes]|uniref:Restriction endonuclease subunit S n=1 Tax=Chryseobacterium indologenes TaxID=253 RepID=A0A411DKP9_CHRID|nr:restriction endonuclease subunit S [Chryseobacterium indologenes]